MIEYSEIENLSEREIIDIYNDVIELNEINIASWYCSGYCKCKNGYNSAGYLMGTLTNNNGVREYSASGDLTKAICTGDNSNIGYHPCFRNGRYAYYVDWGYCRAE